MEAGKNSRYGLPGICAAFHLPRDKVADHFRIGLAQKYAPFRNQLVAQRLEILDNAIVDQRDIANDMRMSVILRRRTMRGPAGVGNADVARERLHPELAREIAELALGAAARNGTVFQRGDAGAVITAIFEALQLIDQTRRDWLDADDPNDTAHQAFPLDACLAAFFASARSRSFDA